MPKSKKSNKPKPSDLGTGAAAKAGRALKNRKSRMDREMAKATGSPKKKKPMKRKNARGRK